ncbi:DUF2845 domain-containing protein [Zooshikella ganghwensis]|uniref:DUF2845 domain-containing protein n=1 Tax=Zooshikella ganghwensis TaxID=202772 RepID=A0A4P9VLP9_9GAMM|nr:DUF2845 domain-containing protein [Zooshikella ganghwensis]RDH42802.1 DUF2845 domain-containing protein [Zooshikella ganghwensis]
MNKYLLSLVFLLLTQSYNAYSASTMMRCGSNLVKVQDDKSTIIQKCGAPITKEFIEREWHYKGDPEKLSKPLQYRLKKGLKLYYTVEQWTYGKPGSFYKHLIFNDNGILQEINTGKRY